MDEHITKRPRVLMAEVLLELEKDGDDEEMPCQLGVTMLYLSYDFLRNLKKATKRRRK